MRLIRGFTLTVAIATIVCAARRGSRQSWPTLPTCSVHKLRQLSGLLRTCGRGTGTAVRARCGDHGHPPWRPVGGTPVAEGDAAEPLDRRHASLASAIGASPAAAV